MRKFTHLVPPLIVLLLAAITGAGCTAKVKASYHSRRANNYYNAGQYDKADIEYKNVLRNNPQDAQAWSRLGIMYFEEGRLGEAAQILTRAQQLATNNLEVRLKLGTIYLQAGKLKEAQDAAVFVLEKSPRDAHAPILLAEAAATNQVAAIRQRLQRMSQPTGTAPLETALGVLSFRQGDLKSAEASFKRAVTLDPKFTDAYSALGNVFIAQKDLKQADQAFKTAADLAPPRSGKALQYAQFKIATGDSAAGKQLLDGLVKKAPDYLPAWLALAGFAANDKKYDDAVTLLGNVVSRDPQNLEGVLMKGRLELQQGHAAEAIIDLERLAKVFPKLPVIYYQLAQAHLANNDADTAIGNLNQALTLDPKYADATLLLAEVQVRTGNAKPAIASLQQLLKQQPQIVPAQLLLAEAYRNQGSLDGAVQIYRGLEKAYPTNAVFPFLLGTALVQQKDNAGARAAFDRALKLAPENMQVFEQLANLDVLEKQYAAALQRVQQKIGQFPKSAALQVLLANVLVARGDTNQAENALSKAIELQPDAQQPYLMLAQLYTTAGQNQKAIADLQSALSKNPTNTAALLLMGMTYNAELEYKDARDAYEKVLAASPKNALALNNLAYLYAENLGQPDKGLKVARQARDLAPTEPAVADTLGWVLYRNGQYSSALSLLRESAAKLAAVPEIQFHLAMTCYMMGDEANARTAFQRALQLPGDLPETNECKQCLAVLAIDPLTTGADTRAWLEKRLASQPNDSVAAMRLAAIYQRDGLADKAVATYEAAMQANPQNATAMVNLARLYEPKDTQKAFNMAKAAYNLTPNNPLVTHTLGHLAFLTGDYKWSLSLLQLTAQAQPQNPEVLYHVGEAYYAEGKVPEARTAMQNALQTGTAFAQTNEARSFLSMTAVVDAPAQALAAQPQVESILKSAPDNVPALMVKAAIAEQKPDLATAAQTYEGVLKHYPDFAPAQKRLAILYAQDPKNDAKAYPLAVKARDAFPTDAEAARTLGIIVYRQGDYSRAATLLQESARQRTTDAELMYYLGMAQYRLKHNAESKTALQRALDLNLSGAPATEAKRVLAELK